MSYLFRFCGFHHKYHPFIFGFKELNFPTLVDWIWLIEWSKVLDSCLPAVLADPPTVQWQSPWFTCLWQNGNPSLPCTPQCISNTLVSTDLKSAKLCHLQGRPCASCSFSLGCKILSAGRSHLNGAWLGAARGLHEVGQSLPAVEHALIRCANQRYLNLDVLEQTVSSPWWHKFMMISDENTYTWAGNFDQTSNTQ